MNIFAVSDVAKGEKWVIHPWVPAVGAYQHTLQYCYYRKLKL